MPTLCTVSVNETISRGDAVCVIGFDTVNNRPCVKRATRNNLLNSKTVFGISKDDIFTDNVGADGEEQSVFVLVAGEVAENTITKLNIEGSSQIVATDITKDKDEEQCRLIRIDRPNGSEFVVGTCDESGNVVIQPRASIDKSMHHVYNVCSYGAIPDYNFATKKGTDNYESFMKALKAMAADGNKTAILVADGHFYLSKTLVLTQGIIFEGTGHAYAESGVPSRSSPGTWLVFPKEVTGIRIRSGANIDNLTKTFNENPLSGEKTYLRNLTVSCKDSIEDGAVSDYNDVYNLSVTDVQAIDDLAEIGRNLIIVAQVGAEKKLHIRIFDESGVNVIDKTEDSLIKDKKLEDFKEMINKLPRSPESSQENKEQLASLAMSIAEYCIPENSCFHGIHASAVVHIENVAVQNFAHDGIHIVGAECCKPVYIKGEKSVVDCDPARDPDCKPALLSDGSQYRLCDGNADGSYVENCLVGDCGRDGIHFSGGDANACLISCCSSVGNGRAGFYDATFGNTYIGCHSAYNNGPNYMTRQDVNASVFINCWSEEGGKSQNDFKGAVTIISGKIGGDPQYMTPDSSAFILEHGVASRAPLVYKNSQGRKPYRISFGDGGTTIQPPSKDMVALNWATLDSVGNPDDSTWLRYMDIIPPPPGEDEAFPPRGRYWWALVNNDGGFNYRHMIRFPTIQANVRQPAPWFVNGIFLGRDDLVEDSPNIPRVSFTAARRIPDTQYNASNELLSYERGDIVWNSEPSFGKPIGWVCVESGTGTITSPPVVGSPAIFSTFGTVVSSSKSYGADHTLDLSDQYITIIADATMTLPESPIDGQTHSIKSQLGTSARLGVNTKVKTANGVLLIDGQTSVTLVPGVHRTFRFSAATNEWEVL